MRSFINTLLLLCLVGDVHAMELKNHLEGVWVVDENSTLEFNLKQKAYSKIAVALMRCMARSSSLAFTDSQMEYVMISHQCEANGKSSNIEGYKAKSSYRVLAAAPGSVAIATRADNGLESFDVIYYESDNKIWIYFPGEPPAFDEHMRIYYTRKQ